MGVLDHDFERRLSSLEIEWRTAYEASCIAGADFLALSASPEVKITQVQEARRRLDQAEERKSQVLAKIERFEAAISRRLQINE